MRMERLEGQSRRSASNTVAKRKITDVMTVRRSRLRSTTVEPAIEPPREPPPNMSESPPPRPECNRIKKISVSDARIWMTRMMTLSILSSSFRKGRSSGRQDVRTAGRTVAAARWRAGQRRY